MSNYPKIYIGPMSKNIVDAIIDFSNQTGVKFGLIPSRRQIEHDGGYVNNWETEDFALYVKTRTKNVILQRDHAGAGQGTYDDDGFESLKKDALYMDLIHIDPWKKYPKYQDGLRETADMIAYAAGLNPNLRFEVGTEEAIRKFEVDELNELLIDLKFYLGDQLYKKIVYLVIQSGTSLSGTTQTGHYDKNRLKKMLEVAHDHKLLAKEHNGDYMPVSLLREKFQLGLDAINIAPEFGVIETKTYLKYVDKDTEEIFYQLCLASNKWQKWVYKGFDPEKNKQKLIEICGHYVFADPRFINEVQKRVHPDIEAEIKVNIKTKLNELYV